MCMAAGIDPPAHVQVHGWLLLGGEKMSNSSVNQIAPGRPHRRLRGGPRPLPPAAGHPLRIGRRLLGRGDDQPLQRRPGQQPGQPAVPGGHGGGLQVRGDRARPRPPTAGWPGWPPTVLDEATEAWGAGLPHLGLEATWRLIRETNAELEVAEPWKAEPGSGGGRHLGQRPRGAPDRVHPHRAGHAHHGRGDLEADRPRRAARPTSGCRRRAAGAATRAVCRWRRAPRCSPGARTDGTAAVGDAVIEWFDSHCHLQEEFAGTDSEADLGRSPRHPAGRHHRPGRRGRGVPDGVRRDRCRLVGRGGLAGPGHAPARLGGPGRGGRTVGHGGPPSP